VEILIVLFLLSIFVLAPMLGGIALVATIRSKSVPTISKAKRAELQVTNALRTLDLKSYVVFENLILNSSGNTAHTEIDHVVVSPYGIFCIETKSHQGSIYGFNKNKEWTQYIGPQTHCLPNPLRQNYKHTKAIELLLGANVKAPIHSYVVFPNAQKISVDSTFVTKSISDLTEKISKHKQPIYNLHDCERILKTLAYASSKSSELTEVHAQEVQAYLNSRAA
jgi:hypothetical protein